jgi:hypothetical protein
MKLVFIIPFFKRHDLTELCFSEIVKQGYPVYAVGSEGESSRKLAEKYGVKYLEYPNNPVSDKHNALTGMLKDVEFDYVVQIGSDDFVSKNFAKELVKVLEQEMPDYTQFTGVYFYHQKDMFTSYFEGFTGAGRCYSKQVLEALNYALWESGKNYGLDTSSRNVLAAQGYTPLMLDMKQMGVEVLDVKYADNITSHNIVYSGKLVDNLSIDVTMFECLQNYNTILHRESPKLQKKLNMKSKIKVVEIETGVVKTLAANIARHVILLGTYKAFDGAEPTTKTKEIEEPVVEDSKECEGCKDEKPCEGCEAAAETTNLPEREVIKPKRGKAK